MQKEPVGRPKQRRILGAGEKITDFLVKNSTPTSRLPRGHGLYLTLVLTVDFMAEQIQVEDAEASDFRSRRRYSLLCDRGGALSPAI